MSDLRWAGDCDDVRKVIESGKGRVYALLEAISEKFAPRAVDLGTYKGESAVALASNPEARVVTIDVADFWEQPPPAPKNLARLICRAQDWAENWPSMDEVDLVYLDLDPHDGIQEREMFEILWRKGYRGLILCDDTCYAPMAALREDPGAPGEWLDLTWIGHGTGTHAFWMME